MISFTPALAVALGTAVGWSLFDLQRRFLSSRMSAWALVVWVTVPAMPIFAAWAVIAGETRLDSGYWSFGATSVALNVVANLAYFRAFQLSGLSVTLPLLSLTPVFSSLLGALFLAQPVGPREALGIGAVVLGALVLSTSRSGLDRRFRPEAGSLLMGFVALCWSITPLLDKLALERSSPAVHGMVLNGGVAAAGVAALWTGGRAAELRAVRGSALLLLSAVACGAVALGTQLVAIQTVPIGVVETLKRGVGGALAVVWGRTVFGEPVSARILLATALLVVGVGLILL